MADLTARLRDFFASPHAHTLTNLMPLGLVVGTCGLLIEAATAAERGFMFPPVANITSSLANELVRPDLDEEERVRKIAQGLKDRDQGVIQIVAEILVRGGPEVARAIPDQTRTKIIKAFHQGMQEPGGALAAIAEPYATALNNPQTDWGTVWAELRQTISRVLQTMKAIDGGIISGAQQRTDNSSGSVEQVMHATGKGSRIENSSQMAIDGTASEHRLPAINREVPTVSIPSDRKHLERLIASHTRRLEELENRAAIEGAHTSPEVITEIQDIRVEIARLQRQLNV